MKDSANAPNENKIKPLSSPILSLDEAVVIQEMVNQNVIPELISVMSNEQHNISEDKNVDTTVTKQTFVDDLLKQCSEKYSVNYEEELKSVSDATPDSSPKKKPAIKTTKAKAEVNGDLPETMFPCQHCERKFTTKQGLERHMHIHVSTVNHAFKCRYCGKAFGTQINRRRHERRHEAGPKKKQLIVSATTTCAEKPKQVVDSLKTSDDNSTGLLCKIINSDKESLHSTLSDGNGDSREPHPCKYCKKVFGTHTNMRRHQRRVHERHLIPKGVRQKGHLLDNSQLNFEQSSIENIYVANTDIEEDVEADDVYIMDISNNISENLAYYIDGKIQSSTSSSNCDVIEVESIPADVLGLNCLLKPIKVELSNNVNPLQCISDTLNDSPCSAKEQKKRRTISPPLLSQIKTEVELDQVTPSCSLNIPLSISISDNSQYQKEKSVYLSSKLKQLLQMQDGNKSPLSPSLLSEVPKLGSTSSSSSTVNRFKRRTASPPSSPQNSPASKELVKQSDGKTTWGDTLGPKIPKLESCGSSPVWSLSGKEERENTNLLFSEDTKAPKDRTLNVIVGHACNQQPLDLSSGVKQKSEHRSQLQAPWESVLDLSINRKSLCDTDIKDPKITNLLHPPCIGMKKKKPTTCMLKKVLLNEYDELEVSGENVQQVDTPLLLCKTDEQNIISDFGVGACDEIALSSNVSPALLETACVTACYSPPILTPSEAHSPTLCPPFRPEDSSLPPILCTNLPSLPDSSCSVPPTPSWASPLSASTQSPLPVLSCTVSPSQSPTHTDEPSICTSPGPPTLSSSCTTSSSSPSSSLFLLSSLSSSSSSSSSCSSPPPLSVVSSIVSPSLHSEYSATTFVKQEKDEEQIISNETLKISDQELILESLNKSFVCNVCESPYVSIKDLAKHIYVHAEEWPFKCEFCVQLFKDVINLSEHRFLLHGVGKIYVCSICKKEFAFLCNLQQHQQDLHPDKDYSHYELENGTLRPQNFTDPTKTNVNHCQTMDDDPMTASPEEDGDLNDSSEELFSTIKIVASGEKSKGPDVRMGLNQHYPSFKPPPFQYHNKNPMGIGTTATNFTTHNIPQTFTTAIHCTKCGKGVDNMPELHKHILVCASASDKKRYTPKKNPVPLKQTVQPKNGIVVLESPEKNNSFRHMGHPKKLNFTFEISKMSSNKLKLSALKKKKQLVHKAILQKNKSSKRKVDFKTNVFLDIKSHVCPYCDREFTYIRSLNKHASYSCPKKPVSPPSKKHVLKSTKKGAVSSARKQKSSFTRRTADAEIKMQSTEVQLGKTRARSLAPTQIQLPSISIKSKQIENYVPQVKSKKQQVSVLNSSPMRMTKSNSLFEVKRNKNITFSSYSHVLGKAPQKLHAKVQNIKPQNKLYYKKKKIDKISSKSGDRIGGPVTRSSRLSLSKNVQEKREDAFGKQESRGPH
ncbi:PR domain zinc finger protein 2 isoform X2 [Bombina bombina]|uniref:PR domain zinc finger protein 2 isoform X2 n=1 Tax=Bombina bombina TaxID=8345 RepID=UPI00235A5185|nr:PR domain zinc finger protein 2 isoform X2 [Bombina bombina]